VRQECIQIRSLPEIDSNGNNKQINPNALLCLSNVLLNNMNDANTVKASAEKFEGGGQPKKDRKIAKKAEK